MEGPSKAEISFEDRKDGSCGVSYIVKEPGRTSITHSRGIFLMHVLAVRLVCVCVFVSELLSFSVIPVSLLHFI